MTEWIECKPGSDPAPGKRKRIKESTGWTSKTFCAEWDWYDVIAYQLEEESKPTMRRFETGATRDSNEDKLDYKGFLSMIAIKQFAEYMHSHRKQADGTLRDSDNWKKGIPVSAYEESMTRHVFEWLQALEAGDRDKAFEIAPAIFFNLQGWMHEEGKLRQ